MRVAVVRVPGSRGDDEVIGLCREALLDGSLECRELSADEKGARALRGCDAVILPPDFAEDAGAARAAAALPVVSAAAAFASRGGPVLGFGDGFSVLVEAGLLEGALGSATLATADGEAHRELFLRVEGRPTPFTAAIPAGRILRMPLGAGAGRYLHYLHDQPDLLEREGRVVLRYVDGAGGRGAPGAGDSRAERAAIAGVTNAAGNVVGLGPRPEQTRRPASPGTCGHGDGRALLDALRLHLAGPGGKVAGGGRVLARG